MQTMMMMMMMKVYVEIGLLLFLTMLLMHYLFFKSVENRKTVLYLDEWRRITLADVLHIAKTIENLCQFKESN
jgi:hypothetical protein